MAVVVVVLLLVVIPLYYAVQIVREKVRLERLQEASVIPAFHLHFGKAVYGPLPRVRTQTAAPLIGNHRRGATGEVCGGENGRVPLLDTLHRLPSHVRLAHVLGPP